MSLCLLLAGAVLLIFGRTLWHEFINYDDGDYFVANSRVQAGMTWSGVTWAFQATHAANWHPLTWLSLMLDAQLFGSGAGGPHLTNVLLHAANTVLLFLLLRRLTGAHWRSAMVAALFGLHPLHVESVAWVAERKDVLSGLFFMLTLLLYARYVEKAKAQSPKSKVFYAMTLSFFVLGLMSKPMLVTMPLVMLLFDYWPLRRLESSTGNAQRSTVVRLVFEKLPFFALSLASSAITLMAQREAIQPLAHIPIGIRAVNAMVSSVGYLRKMFWPVDLALPYPYPLHWSFGLFWMSAAIFLVLLLVVISLGRKRPFLVTGWFWYLGMLVPVIGLVQVGAQAMADRYTYLPLIGVFIMLVWGAGEVFGRWRLPPLAIWSLALLVLAVCSARTLDQLRHWKNSGTLFSHVIAITQNNDIAYYNLGEFCASQGLLDEAKAHYLKAIQIRPSYDDALNNLGVALAVTGVLDEAIVRIQEAIRHRPGKADAHYNLGNVLVMQKKLDEAARAYSEALRCRPDYPEAHNNLANVLALQGRREEAMTHYREVLRLNPDHRAAQQQLQVLESAR